MHPAIFVLTFVSCIVIAFMNIRYSLFFIIFLSIMTPLGQKIEIFSLNFNMFRLLILAGWAKIIFSQKLKMGKIEKTDKIIIYWVIVSFIIYMIQQFNIHAFVNRLGFAYNAIGIYFLYRILLKRTEEIDIICNTLAIVSALVAICMINEQWTGKNLFHVFGGVEEFTAVRMGRLRSQGPFAHAINAGVFGATMLPIYYSMWRQKWGSAFLGIIGTLSACVIVITSFSSTSVVACVAGFTALLFWHLKNYMRIVRYSVLFIALVTQMIISSPIWAYIKQVDLIKGSSVYHRFVLVDNLINRVSEWFLIGSTSYIYWGYQTQDKANQYFLEAVSGGFLRLALFVMIIVYSFKLLGVKIQRLSDASTQKKLWAFGSSLFANLVAFLGISYWDQMLYVWYLLLALITSICLMHDDTKLLLCEQTVKGVESNKQITVSRETKV